MIEPERSLRAPVKDDIARWLDGLGLGQYARAFADNAVGLGELPFLTDEDLTSLGLPLGPRRRLQAAIAALARSSAASEERQPEARPTDRRGTVMPGRQLTVFCDLMLDGARWIDPGPGPRDRHLQARSCAKWRATKAMSRNSLVMASSPTSVGRTRTRTMRSGRSAPA
jgi:hypothetical protein